MIWQQHYFEDNVILFLVNAILITLCHIYLRSAYHEGNDSFSETYICLEVQIRKKWKN